MPKSLSVRWRVASDQHFFSLRDSSPIRLVGRMSGSRLEQALDQRLNDLLPVQAGKLDGVSVNDRNVAQIKRSEA